MAEIKTTWYPSNRGEIHFYVPINHHIYIYYKKILQDLSVLYRINCHNLNWRKVKKSKQWKDKYLNLQT